MSRGTLFYTVAIVIIILLGIALHLFSQRTGAQNVVQLSVSTETLSTTLFSVQTATYEPTIAFEKTAIAIFTLSPEFALSSTPFYAEIIYNDVVRKSTETPYAYGFRTAQATTNVTSTSGCSPTVWTWSLSDLSTQIADTLETKGIDAIVNVVSAGVAGFDEACAIPFQPIRSSIDVSVNVQSVQDINPLTITIDGILEVLGSYKGKMQYVSNIRSIIHIYFDGRDGQVVAHSEYDNAIQAYNNGLRGYDLLKALGGFLTNK